MARRMTTPQPNKPFHSYTSTTASHGSKVVVLIARTGSNLGYEVTAAVPASARGFRLLFMCCRSTAYTPGMLGCPTVHACVCSSRLQTYCWPSLFAVQGHHCPAPCAGPFHTSSACMCTTSATASLLWILSGWHGLGA